MSSHQEPTSAGCNPNNSKFSLKKYRTNQPRSVKGYSLQQKKRSLTSSILDLEKQKSKEKGDRSFQIPQINPEDKNNGNEMDKNASSLTDRSPGTKEVSSVGMADSNYQTNSCRFVRMHNEGKGSGLHDSEMCVCDHCTCGRHLCNLHANDKPKINHNSLYKRDYNRKGPSKLIMPLRHGESPSIEGKITPYSTYGKDFYNKARSMDSRLRPEDCIKDGGPFMGVTTYGNGFVNFKKQLVYPKGKLTGGETVTNLPFVGNSTYRKEFSSKKSNSFVNEVKDSLRMGDTFFGNTTYNSNFPKYDTSYSTSPWANKQLAMGGPDFKHQYGMNLIMLETTYKNDYLKNRPTICPAKTELETKSKGFFRSSKGLFQENSDFKSFDPEFHALSTAKVS